MSGDQSKLDILERMVDGFNAHDIDAIMCLFTDDCVFVAPRGADPWGRRFEGQTAVRDGLGARFTTIPGARYSM